MSPPSRSIAWHVESPATEDPVQSTGISCRGWAYAHDTGGIRLVGIRFKHANSTIEGVYGFARPDVQAAHPDAPTGNVGWEIRTLLPAGRHSLGLEFQLATGDWLHVADISVRMSPPWLPQWSPWTDPAELLRFQFPAHAAHSPRPLRPEHFTHPSQCLPALPRMAIVTPSYNQGWCLGVCMDSVLAHGRGIEGKGIRDEGEPGEHSPTSKSPPSFPENPNKVPPIEIDYIVQDGGSTDGSAELIGARASRLAAWESAPDGGQSHAIAKGFAKTSGKPTDLMAWINSDDFYMPGALRFVAEYFARHPEVDVVYGHRVVVDREGQEIARWYLPKHDPEVLRLNDFVPQETLFWRRRIWDKVGGLDTSFQFAMDWDLLLRFQAAGAKIVRLPYFLACFRVHPQQKTSALISTQGQAEIDALRRRTFGREITPDDLLKGKTLQRYLRRSAWIEQLWKWSIRSR